MSRRGITRGLPQPHTAPTTADSTITFLPEAAIGASAEVAGAGTVGFTPAAALGGFAEIAGDSPVGFALAGELLPIPSDGLVAWYDPAATYVTKDGGDKISAVVKRAGSGGVEWDLAQAVGAKQPTWMAAASPNGGPTIRYVAASATHLASAAIAANQPITVLTRFYWSGAASVGFTIMDGRTGNTRRVLHNGADNSPRMYAGSLTAPLAATYSPAGTFQWSCTAAAFDGASSLHVIRNATYTDTNATVDPGAAAASGIVLGDFGTAGGEPFGGDMVDVLVYSRALSLAEIQRIFNWLETR